MEIRPVILEGSEVRLEPLRPEHAPGLFAALSPDPAAIFRWMRAGPPTSLEEMRRWVSEALAPSPEGPSLAFAQLEKASGRVAGSTSYLHIRASDRALEIGRTWLGRPWQRTALNTEAKLLLLTHAFEAQGAVRVELVTDARNEPSRRAILRLGAAGEGILRRHRITQGGYVRDTVVYSLVDSEWPAAKARLRARLKGDRAGPALPAGGRSG